MKKIVFLFLASLFFMQNSFANDKEFNVNEKKQIEKIVRDYLLNNPQFFFEWSEKIETYDKQRKQQQEVLSKQAIQQKHNVIFNKENSPFMGNENGKIKIVEFFDYNCYYCVAALPTLEALIKENSEIKIIIKEFPIFGEGSQQATKISLAVNELYPKQYALFHKKLLQQQGQKNKATALAVIQQMGLDKEKITNLADMQHIEDMVQENYALTQALNINATPAFIIGDEIVLGTPPPEDLAEIVKCGKINCS